MFQFWVPERLAALRMKPGQQPAKRCLEANTHWIVQRLPFYLKTTGFPMASVAGTHSPFRLGTPWVYQVVNGNYVSLANKDIEPQALHGSRNSPHI